MIGDDDFFMQNADYHYGASDAEKLYGRGYDDYNRNLWRDGILMKPPTLEEEKRSQKNKDGAALVFTIVGGGGFIVTLIFMLLIGDAVNHNYEGILFLGWIISLIVLFIIFVILYRENNRMIDEVYTDQTVSQKKQTCPERIDEKIGQTSKINKVQKKQTYPKRAVKAQNINSKPATTTKKLSYDYKPSSSKTSSVDKSAGKANGGNNTFKIAILTILCIIIIAGIFVLSSNQTPTITVNHSHFIIPDGFTEIKNYAKDDLEININEGIFHGYVAGLEDYSQENHIYIMVIDDPGGWVFLDDETEYIINHLDYKNKVDYKMKIINDQYGYLIPKSQDAGYIMNVSEPIYIFAYIKEGDITLVGATDESYLYEVIG